MGLCHLIFELIGGVLMNGPVHVSANNWRVLLGVNLSVHDYHGHPLSAIRITLEVSSLNSLMTLISSQLILGLDGGISSLVSS